MFKYLWNMFIIIILSLSLPHIPRSAFSFFSLPFLPPFLLPLLFPFPLSSLLFSFPFPFLFFFPFSFSLSFSLSLFFLPFSLPFPFFFPLPLFPLPDFCSPSRFLVSGGAVCPPFPPPPPHWLRPWVAHKPRHKHRSHLTVKWYPNMFDSGCFQTSFLYNCASATQCRRGMTKRQAPSCQWINYLAALPTAADSWILFNSERCRSVIKPKRRGRWELQLWNSKRWSKLIKRRSSERQASLKPA